MLFGALFGSYSASSGSGSWTTNFGEYGQEIVDIRNIDTMDDDFNRSHMVDNTRHPQAYQLRTLCPWCHTPTYDDRYGHCSACGGPRGGR